MRKTERKKEDIPFFECLLKRLFIYDKGVMADCLQSVVTFLIRKDLLSLLDSAYRTYACTGTAIDTFFSVDLIFPVPHADRANRTLSFTRTARYTSVTNTICHTNILLNLQKNN